MKIRKNCLKTTALLWLALIYVGSVAAKDMGAFTVDPGTSGSLPSVSVETTASATWNAFFYEVSLGQSSLMTTATFTATSSTLEVQPPEVEKNTFVEIGLTTHSEMQDSDFRWRTFARPKGKRILDYDGQKKILPPDDFDDYWEKAKKELAAVDAQTSITRVPDKDTSTGLLFRVELDSVENTRIVGWFYVPRAAYKDGDPDGEVINQFPAIIITPGYGGAEPPIDRTKLGFITFSTNPRNHGPSKAYWKSPVEHLLYNITKPEAYYYKLAALDCLQAAKFVLDRKEVDSKRVGTEGGSQGGYVAVATAALEPRIACVAANVIAFTDYPDGMELAERGGQTQMRDLLAEKDTSRSLVMKSLQYTDGANLITRVKAPVQICMGGVDPVCPYICGIVAYNRISKGVAKEFHIAPNAAHEVPPVMRQWNMQWYQRWLKPETPVDPAVN